MTTRPGIAALTVTFWLGCSTHDHPSAVSNTTAPPLMSELVQRAERALEDSARLDYRRPFVDVPYDRAAARRMFFEACRAGDHRSCWMATEISDNSHFRQDHDRDAPALVKANCRAGDIMSCRAINASWGDGIHDDAPGWAGRLQACYHDKECDWVQLRRECEAGFPWSCNWLRPKDIIDQPAMAVRIIGLARTGCRQDITSECFLLQSLTQPEVNPDQPRSAVDDYLLACERQCAINRKSCFEAATTYLDRGERLKARNAIEASCQFSDNGYLREKACLDLEVFYESQSFPEPVGHRARELSAWRCKQRRDHGEDSCD